ncbi:endolytic transglycosylase MltG [Peribacillus frigoritolerans]|uniref:Endolytic murein transglycosylase n=2 Tax=Bacillaceae TaxID=186817 RepID=A0AAW9NEL3_9BACI|nr:endolytic transglycosylase MltG [Peribacillus frigoritolerans]MEC0276963.1 endolytic transglycosylase MltG [Peribacillus castrilensis]MEC0298039.1 endolytic transglycosylase MltG [Peribacillus castrilensis]MEC0344757.1 endolytic transglycosylase MltG [Peribacillus castrilensis]TFH63615.1 endolytic transglycosylase MltG [Peribacillus frigoritolerans]
MNMDEKDKNLSKKEHIRMKLLEQQGEAKLVRKIIMITIASLILLIGIVGLVGFLYINSAMKPVDPDDDTIKKVKIPIGSSVNGISTLLEEQGIIKDARVFKYYIKFRNESGFQAGEYKLSPSMPIEDIVTSIKTGKLMKEAAMKITIPEGKQLIQIADIIAGKTGEDPKKVFKKLNDKKFVNSMQEQFPQLLTSEIENEKVLYPLEGYLFPATYDFYEEKPTLESIVIEMLKKTEETLQAYEGQMDKNDYSVHEMLTFASLVEEEATAQVDRGKIASVFYNRIEEDMPLQTDPTVLYAKGSHKSRVYYKDLEVKSPYNTYKNKGLPPGPIANAGTTSIDAVLKPEKTDYLYFLATPEGEVLYSETLDDHNNKKAEHISNK